jgi:hypothetical protein
MQALFVPGQFELAFQPLRNGTSLADFVAEDGEYDLSPSSDDSPYFFHLDFGLPRPIQSALVTSVLLTVGLVIFGFLMGSASTKQDSLLHWSGMVLYAALIGCGFMLIEIPLIQRFQLVLGYPILSLVVVLGTLLLAGGLGSLYSQRWTTAQLPRRVVMAALWIAALAVIYRFALASILDVVLAQSLVIRVLAVIALAGILGLPLGIPFASLLRRVGQARDRVALLWAINGAFSVLGSVLSAVISMQWGFSWALLLGALLYLILAVLNATLLRKQR